MLTGQIDTPFLGKGKGFLHEAERQLEMLRTVTRRAEQVRRADEIAEVLIPRRRRRADRAAATRCGRNPHRLAVSARSTAWRLPRPPRRAAAPSATSHRGRGAPDRRNIAARHLGRRRRGQRQCRRAVAAIGRSARRAGIHFRQRPRIDSRKTTRSRWVRSRRQPEMRETLSGGRTRHRRRHALSRRRHRQLDAEAAAPDPHRRRRRRRQSQLSAPTSR